MVISAFNRFVKEKFLENYEIELLNCLSINYIAIQLCSFYFEYFFSINDHLK